MESISWNYILTHPSEFVRIDEQLRLLLTQLSIFKQEFLTDSILQEVKEHEKIITSFREALNTFGFIIFGGAILSDGEAEANMKKIIENQEQSSNVNFFNEFNTLQVEMFRKLFGSILDKMNTEKVFKKFLIIVFDGYINAEKTCFNLLSDDEKELIMQNIIKRTRI